jgi:ferric-dicitrate binding protein FerR (iron transport regulator)
MKNQSNNLNLLTRYHDGQTTEAENQQVAQLLASDPDCRRQLEAMRQLTETLQAGYAQPRISDALANRLADIPHAAQQHIITRLAGGWALAASILLLVCSMALYQYQQSTNIDPTSWQLDRMALGQNTTQYGVELTDNHKELQLAALLIADSSTSEGTQ